MLHRNTGMACEIQWHISLDVPLNKPQKASLICIYEMEASLSDQAREQTLSANERREVCG